MALWYQDTLLVKLSVTSDGTTGSQWVTRLMGKGIGVEDSTKALLLSTDFKPTSGVTTQIVVLRGRQFSDHDRRTSIIRTRASEMACSAPNAEAACLIRSLLCDADLDIMQLSYIVAMHEPIERSTDVPRLLSVMRGVRGPWLGDCDGHSGYSWTRDSGFAFVSPAP